MRRLLRFDPKGTTIPAASLSRANYFTRSRFIHPKSPHHLCASLFLVVCVLLRERERESCVDDDNPVSTSSSTITHIFTITFRFLSFLHFSFPPFNPCPPLFATGLTHCTFLTRFASPKLPIASTFPRGLFIGLSVPSRIGEPEWAFN